MRENLLNHLILSSQSLIFAMSQTFTTLRPIFYTSNLVFFFCMILMTLIIMNTRIIFMFNLFLGSQVSSWHFPIFLYMDLLIIHLLNFEWILRKPSKVQKRRHHHLDIFLHFTFKNIFIKFSKVRRWWYHNYCYKMFFLFYRIDWVSFRDFLWNVPWTDI